MPRYEQEFKEQVVRRLMPPNAMSVAEVSRETGVSEAMLYAWRNEYRRKGKAVPADPSNPENWSGENKLAVVIVTASLNEAELGEYCRKKGLYPEQVARWREAAVLGNAGADEPGLAQGVGGCEEARQAPGEREQHPERWSDDGRNWRLVEEVWLNPPRESHTDAATSRKAA